MVIKNCFMKNNHFGAFKNHEWALIIGVKMVQPFNNPIRPCYHLLYQDGSEDFMPILEDNAKYEFTENRMWV